MNIKTINLFDKATLKKHNLTHNSEEWKQLAKHQRLMRLNVSSETATYFANKGFDSANHIAITPLQQFLQLCQDFPDSEQLKEAYKVAHTIRSASMHIMANAKNLHPSSGFSNTKAFTADPDIFTSFEDLPSYEMLFGDLDYYDCSEFSSIFGPAAYLLDLMRITQVYISDANVSSIPKGLHFFDRRPDIKKLKLTQENTTTEVLKLKIVNERIEELLQSLIHDAQSNYVAWLDTATYPFVLPFCLPLIQVHSGLEQAGLSLLTIYKTLQVDAKYFYREILTLSPNQHTLVMTVVTDAKAQAELWGLDDPTSLANMEAPTVLSKQADIDASQLLDLLKQNLNVDTETTNAVNFYICKHLAKHESITEHYFYIKDDIIKNLNVEGDSTVIVDNLDMIGRFIRFSRYIGLSFQDTDWLLNVAEFLMSGLAPYDSGTQQNRIDALCGDDLATVGKIYQLADLLQQPVANILNSLGIIKTYGVGADAVSAAPFDVIFNSANNNSPYHPSYAGNPLFYKDTVQTWDLSEKEIPLPVINILNQFGLGKADLLTLGTYTLKILNISTQQLPLSVENLSLLYSYSSIAIWLNISIPEFVVIAQILNKPQAGIDTHKNPIDDLIALVNAALWMQKHNINAFKVDYIINASISRYVDLGFHQKDLPKWFISVKKLIVLSLDKDKNPTDATTTKLINSVAGFLNTTQETMKVLFDMNTHTSGSKQWIVAFLTTDDIITVQTLIINFSRLLTLNKLLQFNNAELLSSIAQYPIAYGFITFPATQITQISINLTQLQGLVAFRDLQNKFNDTDNNFIDYIEKKCEKSKDADKILHHITNWDNDQVQAVLARYKGESVAAFLSLVDSIFSLTSSLGNNVNMLFSLSDKTTGTSPDMSGAESLLLTQLKSCYTPSNFQVATQIISESVLEEKRDVTATVAIWTLAKTYPDINSLGNLSEFLLTDVNVSAKISTSYIKEAINASQLYLQRVKLSIEQHIDKIEIEEAWWQWISNYRIWEANREIYLYPENYLEPTLRKNQSKAFQDFSQTLLQSGITAESVEAAFKKYFKDFEQLVDLNYFSSYYTENDKQAVYYFFAVSKTHPPKYYYCTYTYELNDDFDFQSNGIWSLWIDTDISINNSKSVTPIYYSGKLMLFWVEIKKINSSTVSSKSSKSDGSGEVNTNDLDVYKATVKYSFLKEDKSWEIAQTLIAEEVVYVNDKNFIGVNQYENADSSYRLFAGLFSDMDSDDWNTVYVSCIDDDIAVYYGPFINKPSRSDIAKINLLPETIGVLEEFETHLFELLTKFSSYNSGDYVANIAIPYIGIRVFNQYLEKTDVKVGACASNSLSVSYFLNKDKRFVIVDNTYNDSLYANLTGNIYSNLQFGNDAQNTQLIVLEPYNIINILPSIKMSFKQFIDSATKEGCIEQAGNSYYATAKYSLLTSKDKKIAQISAIIGSAPSPEMLDIVDKLLMTGVNNKALMLFANIDVKQSRQFSIKNKSGAFLHKNKSSSWLLNLQSKKIKQSSIISPNLSYNTPLLVDSSFVIQGSPISGSVARKMFSAFVVDNYIVTPFVNGSGGFKKAFHSLLGSITYGFANTDKFVQDMKVNAWKGLRDYIATKLKLTVDLGTVQKIFNIMCSAPYIRTNFFAESLVDRKNIAERNKISDAVYQALRVKNFIDGNFCLSYPMVADQGFQVFKTYLASVGAIKNAQLTDREFENIFTQIINCNAKIDIQNTPYPSELTNTKYSLNDCGEIDYDIIRMGTPAFKQLQKIFTTTNIDQVLSLENQQIPMTEGNTITDLIPPKGAKLPSILKNDQIDFAQGPYAQYYWELFFHAPILIAKNLSNQNKFEEAIDWLGHIFNPSKKRKHITPTTFHDKAPKKINEVVSATIFKTLQNTNLDDKPYIDKNGDVNKNYKGNEDLSFLKLSKAQTLMIRDILSNYLLLSPVNHYWNFQPFRNHTLQTIKQLLTDGNPAIQQYEDDPFDPFAIARLRIGAFEKYVLMLYVDILIQWGDSLFTIDTRESINEATMLYLYADDLLGAKPKDLGAKHQQTSASFTDILNKYRKNPIPEFLVDMENQFSFKNTPTVKAIHQPFNDLNSYFCIPENSQLIARWDTIADRLRKIHNSLDIEGNFQQLALFAPPINPLDLIRAVASGGNTLNASPHQGDVPIYRFASIVQLARQCIDNVISMGRLLEGNLEKCDAENLSLLHTTQEGVALNLISILKQDSIEQEQNVLDGLNSSLKSTYDKKQYYDRLIVENISHYESEAQTLEDVGLGFSIASSVASVAASIAYGVPQNGSPFALTYGGVQLGGTVSAIATGLQGISNYASYRSQRLLTNGSYDRRKQEWVFSSTQAKDQAEEIQSQISASEVRIKTAQQDLINHTTQIQQNKAIADYLQHKFTNEALYQWLSGRIAALYHQQYQLALETAVLAQKAYQFELNNEQEFINIIYWDSAHRGLLAGESLLSSLTSMEQSYKTYLSNRKLEIEKTISLSAFAPQALINFKNKGDCTFVLTERSFDYDFPGHYQRQIKSISISIPAIIGPYQNIHAILSQLHNSVVLDADINAVKYLLGQPTKSKPMPKSIRQDWRGNQKIAISRGIEDSGLFQLDFKDELYLPFENTGAVSTWSLSMPPKNNKIDYSSISDVIINIRYTAMDGGRNFANEVNDALANSADYPTALYYNLVQSFSSNWQAFMQDHSDVKKQQLKFDFNARELKYFNSVSLDSVIFKITTSSDITIPTKTLILSLNVNNQEFPVNITNQVSDGDSEDVFDQYWCSKSSKKVSTSTVIGIGWATQLGLEKNSTQDTIDTNWTLSFDLTAMNIDKDFKKMLKNGFLDPKKLIKIELMALCCGKPTI
ncbi:hypothetical protein [uncultured Gammaproteobacteria bacterium]|nr:hypothetical protein [uncultured Gammaproteobacteria bacterium]